MDVVEGGGGVTSVARAFDVLDLVSRSGEASFSAIQHELKVPRSSLFHLLRTLTARGILEQKDRKGTYTLGSALLALAAPRDANADFLAIVRSLLEDLADTLNETAGFYELCDDCAVIVDAVSGNHPLLYSLTVGDAAALHAVSAGKLLLASLPNDRIEAILDKGRLERFTVHTITSKKRLWAELEGIRRTGIAYSREERRIGIGGMAIAAAANGEVRGAFGVALPMLRLDAQLEARIERALRAAAERFRARMEC